MENQLPTEQVTTEKKLWISPEMQEMPINGGPAYLVTENASYQS
ncbi:hypothetical protein [Emticicia soli]|uniref:Paeninodin family lasso peptide n=1 Tax=Emticicia soli TaxID=2027878 RepID=A0ABW5J6T8_9BACT